MKLVHIPKTRLCTVSGIMKATGFGRPTVHRALNGENSVSFEGRETVSKTVFLLNAKAIGRHRTEIARSHID